MVLILATFPFILQWLLVELVWRPIVQDSTVSSETQTSVTDHN